MAQRTGTELIVFTMLISFVALFLNFAYSPTDVKADTSTDVQADTSIEDTAEAVKVGDAKTVSRLVIIKDFVDSQNNCEFCTRMEYTPGSQREAGLAYKDDKLDLGESQRIVFFARGQPGNEVSFVAAGNETNVPSTNDTDIFPRVDFAVVTENVTLKNDWQRFEIGLDGTELSDATYPFGIQLAANSSQKQIFYIKGVSLDSQPAQNPIPTVTDSLNSTNSTGPLYVQIGANTTNSTVPSAVNFVANSTGGLEPYSFSWNFDDGSNSTDAGEKVSHTFEKSGLYNVTLSANDSGTPSLNASASILVTITSSANKTDPGQLSAQIGANSTDSSVPSVIEFTANSTGGLEPYSFSWNFDDGSNSTDAGEKVSHTFEKSGLYNVTLSANDSGTPSLNASASILVTITSSANKTGLDANSTGIVDANSTGIVDANSTGIVDANSTGIVDANSTGIVDANSTGIVDANSTGIVDANSTGIVDANSTGIVDANSTGIVDANSTGIVDANSTGSTKTLVITNEINDSTAPAPTDFERNSTATNDEQDPTSKVTAEIVTPGAVITDGNNAIDANMTGDDVASTNHTPIAVDESVTLFTNKATSIDLQGTDPDNDPIRFELVSDPSRGTIAGFDKSTGTLTYIPNPNSPGSDTFTFKVIDSQNAESNIGRLTGTVNQLRNNVLTVADVSAATASDEPVNIILKATNRANVDSLKFTLMSNPLHGKLSEFTNIDGESVSVTYTPDKGYSGNDQFKFKVDDKDAVSNNIGKVSITVITSPPSPASNRPSDSDSSSESGFTESDALNSNSPPVANNQYADTDQNRNIRINLDGRDADKDKMTFSIVKQPTHGSLNNFDTSTGRLSYKPDRNFAGEDYISFKITDQKHADSNMAIVSIRVKDSGVSTHSNSYIGKLEQDKDAQSENIIQPPSVNHKPKVKVGPNVVVYEGTNDVSLQGSGRDLDGDTLTYSWEQTSGPLVELNDADTANPTFNAPEIVQEKVLRFILTVIDERGGQDTDDIKITVKDKPPGGDKLLVRENLMEISVNQTGH